MGARHQVSQPRVPAVRAPRLAAAPPDREVGDQPDPGERLDEHRDEQTADAERRDRSEGGEREGRAADEQVKQVLEARPPQRRQAAAARVERHPHADAEHGQDVEQDRHQDADPEHERDQADEQPDRGGVGGPAAQSDSRASGGGIREF